MKYPADKRILVAFGLAALILGSVGVISYRSTSRLIQSENSLGQSEAALGHLGTLLQEILEVESAARGYVLSGADFYLEPYYQARKRIVQTFQTLEDASASDPGLRRNFQTLKGLLVEKISYHQRQIDVRSKRGFDEARKLFGAGEGHELMDQIRSVAGSISSEQTRILNQHRTEASFAAQESLYSLIIGSLLSGAIVLAVHVHLNREISRRKQSERQIRRLNEDLELRVAERTEQLAAANDELAVRNRDIEHADHMKSEFLASMSHELRTPLNAIVGFSDLMAEERSGPLLPKQKRFVEHIRTGARHLLQLINDILDLSKIEAGRIELDPESFLASEASLEVLSVVSPLAVSKRIQVECRIDPGLTVYADRVRFKQILYNLLSNAVKFTPENGRVWVDSTREDGGDTCFSVRDTGVGIPSQEQQAIFDEFHQVGDPARGVREGTGLGLSITRKLIKLHKGRIWLESEPEKGSTFFFVIPARAVPDRSALAS